MITKYKSDRKINISSDSSNAYIDKEITLTDLLSAIWGGKYLIIIMVFAFFVGSTVIAYSLPDIYESKANLVINNNIYGGMEQPQKVSIDPNLITGGLIKNTLDKYSGSDHSLVQNVSISYDYGNGVISVSKSDQSANAAFRSVEFVYNNLNVILKDKLLENISLAVNSAESLQQFPSRSVQQSISDIYAVQLYKQSILKNPASLLLLPIESPKQASMPIKPRRFLIVTLGVFLGGVLGLGIVFVRFAFRSQSDNR